MHEWCFLIGVVPEYMALVPSEITNVLWKKTIDFDTTHPIIISWKLIEVICNFFEKEPPWEVHEDQNILETEITVEATTWDPSSIAYSC